MTTILGASASGMMAAQRTVDSIGSNIANSQSTAYKRERLLAEGMPDPVQDPQRARLGVSVTESDLIFAVGTAVATGDPLNFAINDDAYYRVTTNSGETAYTRNGNLGVDPAGQVTLFGQQLDPPIAVPPGARAVQVGSDGNITAVDQQGNTLQAGEITLFRFSNPKGLRDIGGGLYTESANSGDIFGGRPGVGEFDALLTGFLEGSNVDIADEMTQMMIAQRIYTANAKSFSIGDDMLRIATQITR